MQGENKTSPYSSQQHKMLHSVHPTRTRSLHAGNERQRRHSYNATNTKSKQETPHTTRPALQYGGSTPREKTKSARTALFA